MDVDFTDELTVAVSFRGIPNWVMAMRLRHQPPGLASLVQLLVHGKRRLGPRRDPEALLVRCDRIVGERSGTTTRPCMSDTSAAPFGERVGIGSRTTPGAAPAPTAKRLPTRRGQRGGLVFTIQRTLNNWVAKWRLPLAALDEDGMYGAATAERVRTFQRALELKADGIVGPSTARWLDQAVGVPLALGPIAAPETVGAPPLAVPRPEDRRAPQRGGGRDRRRGADGARPWTGSCTTRGSTPCSSSSARLSARRAS